MAQRDRIVPIVRPSRIGWRLGLAGLALAGHMVIPAHGESLVIISRDDCARLTVHQPAPDVAYQPGIDVQGRPVTPADLPGTPRVAMPDEIAIDITVDIRKRFGLPADSTLFKPEARIGTVVVRPDGSALFNSQPLTSSETRALAALCQGQTPR